jgi:hypothetical protein
MSKIKSFLFAVKITLAAIWEFCILGVRPFGAPKDKEGS